MIGSWPELVAYVRRDLSRYDGHPVSVLVRAPQTRWQLRLRLTEWWCNTRTDAVGRGVGLVLRARLQAHGVRLGYTIPLNTTGPGLRLPHWGTIVISGDAVVGADCQILQGVTLGATSAGAPRVADRVFLGPNVTVMGPQRIGEGAVIAAGAVVTCDVPAGQTWAGVPARPL